MKTVLLRTLRFRRLCIRETLAVRRRSNVEVKLFAFEVSVLVVTLMSSSIECVVGSIGPVLQKTFQEADVQLTIEVWTEFVSELDG